MNSKEERRKFERVLLPSKPKVTAKLKFFDRGDTDIVVDITNLSEEGLGLNFGTDLSQPLGEGDLIILIEIEGLPKLKFLVGIEMKLVWIMSYGPSGGACAGCEFVNISPAVKEQIRQFVQIQINQKLNYIESLK